MRSKMQPQMQGTQRPLLHKSLAFLIHFGNPKWFLSHYKAISHQSSLIYKGRSSTNCNMLVFLTYIWHMTSIQVKKLSLIRLLKPNSITLIYLTIKHNLYNGRIKLSFLEQKPIERGKMYEMSTHLTCLKGKSECTTKMNI